MIEHIKSAISTILPRNAFARGVSVLVGGTAGAQLLLVLAAPVLTRLYTPEDFGMLAVYVALLTLVGVVSSLRYNLAIPLPEDEVESANVAVLSLLLVAISTGLTAILVAMLSSPIANLIGVPALANYLWLLPVGILLSGGYTVFNYWSVRTKRYSTIAGTRIRQAIMTIVIQLAAFKLGAFALLVGQVAGQSVGMASLARPALAVAAFKKVSRHGVWQAAVRYRRFPIFSIWGAGFNKLSTQLPTLMLASFFGSGIAGMFFLAERVLALPVSLIGNAVSQVFFSSAPAAKRNGTLSVLVATVQEKLAYIAMPPTIIIVVAGPDLFHFSFGYEWTSAGEFARWMAPWLYFTFITSPISLLFPVLEKQKEEVIFQGFLLLLRITAITIGVWVGDMLITVIFYSFSSMIGYLGVLIWEVLVTENDWSIVYKPTLKVLFISLIIISPLIYAEYLDCSIKFLSAAFVLSCVGFSAWYIYLTRAVWRDTDVKI